ncbi:hypothetical protein P43SY_009883 [Pythium insidiosum]|uniref:C2H2-type domain-containing protein n=1 Tax=Pythium insidiosum TaxID=114742 RepID=A0AAD5Q6M9_PYTIN|nr:hypothetical protein P43SY_009883 [Pythium insidiosum]
MASAPSSSASPVDASPPASAPPSSAQWLAQLNEQVGLASRRLFRLALRLESCSRQQVRGALPELCTLAATLVARAASFSPRECAVIRAAFGSHDAQWLGRGAVESGATGVLCHALIDELDAHAGGDQRAAVRLVATVLLDAMLRPCVERLRADSRPCEWRQRKPAYYSMPCAGVWNALQPFVLRLATRHSEVFVKTLHEYVKRLAPAASGKRNSGAGHGPARSNCRFVQVSGLLRLVEELAETASERHSQTATSVLVFLTRLCLVSDACSQPSDAADALDRACFRDLLLDKLFHELREVLFRCAGALQLTRRALRRVLVQEERRRDAPDDRAALAAFVSVACVLVNGLAHDLSVDWLAHEYLETRTMRFVVGFVAHVQGVDPAVVRAVVQRLLDLYEACESSDPTRLEILFWIVYVVVCQGDALMHREHAEPPAIKTEGELPAVCAPVQNVDLQRAFCSAVSLQDMQRMPLHWMERLWRRWFQMTDEEIEAFAAEARASGLEGGHPGDQDDDGGAAHAAFLLSFRTQWKAKLAMIPFRAVDRHPSLLKLLGAPFVATLDAVVNTPQAAAVDELLTAQLERRKRRRRVATAELSAEHDETRQDALLLPDIMLRVCSFMSAKRLCRLSLVCKSFAGVARHASLWRALHQSLVAPLRVQCTHGSLYEHDWRLMYRDSFSAIKKLRARQREYARKRARQAAAAAAGDPTLALAEQTPVQTYRLCRVCGCNQILPTREAWRLHKLLHERYVCPVATCRRALTSAATLRQHTNAVHVNRRAPKDPTSSAAASTRKRSPRLAPPTDALDEQASAGVEHVGRQHACPIAGCGKTYKSPKWLATHLKKQHAAGDAPADSPAQ